jgi:hypothetical protein
MWLPSCCHVTLPILILALLSPNDNTTMITIDVAMVTIKHLDMAILLIRKYTGTKEYSYFRMRKSISLLTLI